MADSHVHFRSRGSYFPASSVRRVPKAWGEEQWIVNKEYCGKKLLLRKDRRCSMHTHGEKDEVFYIQQGRVLLEMGKKKYELAPGDFIHIRAGQPHRFTGLEESEIFEFSTTHSEDDSFRTELSGHADPERYARQSALLGAFTRQSVLVIGDVMLDRYTEGEITRISPEAPIPVIQVSREWEVLGGAGNSAHNVRALGGRVRLLSVTGEDRAEAAIRSLCKASKIPVTFLRAAGRPTVVKQRVVSGSGQQVVRVDREATDALPPRIEGFLLRRLPSLVSRATAILVSDYAKGAVTARVIRQAVRLGKKKGIPVIIDPKPRAGFTHKDCRGASLLTPNVREARALLGGQGASPEELGRRLSRATGAAVILTRGGEGLDVWRRGKLLSHFDSLSPAVVDVSGAGDTVAAVAALTLGAGGSLTDAADMGNRAASVVVQKRGTAILIPVELDAAL